MYRDSTQIDLKCGLIKRATGSAYLELGNSKMSVAVYGPREGRGGVSCDFNMCTFSTMQQRRKFQRDRDEKWASEVILNALLPSIKHVEQKTAIDIYVTVMECDGWMSTVAASISCASLALVDAGIELLDLVACSSVVLCVPLTFHF